MENLKFKKVGHFAEELSARYRSSIKGSKDLFVVIFKCAYSKSWKLRFETKSGYELDDFTCHYSSFLWDIKTKKELVEVLEKDIKISPLLFRSAEDEAINLEIRLSKWLESDKAIKI